MMKAEVMKQKRTDNKGFSLVELIIVMAIMAILVGIVGTQAIPYMNRARLSKDRELLSAISTAAVTAYTMNVEDLPSGFAGVTDLYTPDGDAATAKWQTDIIEMISYDTMQKLNEAASSEPLKTADAISITITGNTLKVEATGGTDAADLEPVESQL